MRGRVALGFVLALFLSMPGAAHATFPGENGKIAFVRTGDIWTMNPDGSGQVNVTDDAPTQGSPSWSPDGTRIAFDQVDAGVIKTWTMTADGTDRVLADDGGVITSRRDPAYSPDGTMIAFTNGAALYRMNPDGTGVVSITGDANNDPDWAPDKSLIVYGDVAAENCHFSHLEKVLWTGGGASQLSFNDTGCNYIVTGSSWAPNAHWVAYYSEGVFCPPTCAEAGLFIVHRGGAVRNPVPGGGPNPAYSPDGTRLAYDDGSNVFTMNVDGTGVSGPLAAGTEPDWQPTLVNKGYARPKAATPLYAPLVPAYKACTSANRQHAAPLSFGSCNPPVQTSDFATVGTPDANSQPAKSVGSLKLVVIGEVPIDPNNGNQADVEVDFSFTDVRRKTAPTNDYPSALLARAWLKITDRNNTPHPGGPGPATTNPIPFEFVVPCTTTPSDSTIGSACAISTTANTLLPGQVLERQRAIWEVFAVEVEDSGEDGNPITTEDNTRFATQGVFVP